MRLTRHFEDRESVEMYDIRDISKEFDKNFKLSQLEDIEEELGIDLILYLKATLNGVWVKGKEKEWTCDNGNKNKIVHYLVEKFEKDCLKVKYDEDYDFHCIFNPLDNCKKVWALTKEELENGKKS